MCWRGEPAPGCSAWVVTELGFYYNVASTTRDSPGLDTARDRSRAFTSQLTWELGALKNVGSRVALGASAQFGFSETGERLAFNGRGRYWLSEDFSGELTAGILYAAIGTSTESAGTGFTSDVRFNYRDRFAFTLRYDVMAHDQWKPAHGFSVGTTLGTKPALFTTGALAVGFAVLSVLYAMSVN